MIAPFVGAAILAIVDALVQTLAERTDAIMPAAGLLLQRATGNLIQADPLWAKPTRPVATSPSSDPSAAK